MARRVAGPTDLALAADWHWTTGGVGPPPGGGGVTLTFAVS
jgi:hypothetical protein